MSFVTSKELIGNMDKQINILLESLQVVLTGHSEIKSVSPGAVKELALELGISSEILDNKISGIIKNN